MRFMRFDDKTARTAETEKNKLAKIENVFDQVVKTCRRVVKPSKYIVIDETMVSFRGGVAFMQYNPAKPDRYAMKVSLVNLFPKNFLIIYSLFFRFTQPAMASRAPC